jgi:hypothetical protein
MTATPQASKKYWITAMPTAIQQIVESARDVVGQPLSKRDAYGRQHHPQLVRECPSLFAKMCREADFDVSYLDFMVNTMTTSASHEDAFTVVSTNLQSKYLVPVIERLENERLSNKN